MSMNSAQTRYSRAVIGLSALYAVLLIGVVMVFNRYAPAGPLGYVLALLPAAPVIGIFAAMARYLIEERDEYLRMLVARQSLIATGFALSVATAWGFLETFKLVPHMPASWIVVLWFAGLGLGSCINHLSATRAA